MTAGVERIVDQVVNPKIYSGIDAQVEEVIYDYLGVEKPDEKGTQTLKFKNFLAYLHVNNVFRNGERQWQREWV